ncbi:hypothetical protein B879_04094 [Cecembia lonarensis LW9]|uniref:Uncharacterized protein n=1 Tax=Cecembia lonarensis (strain CCUG 58316 / KCTC 22772 / LW9) TaxID=1225176 RepID=K1LAA6_CECL9|nr:hypothetical protein B879_04094 [Cecembia lonarensis LW9]
MTLVVVYGSTERGQSGGLSFFFNFMKLNDGKVYQNHS